MKQLEELRTKLHERILKLRAIEGLLADNDLLERLWFDSTPEQKAELEVLVMFENKDLIVKWMKTHPSIDPGEQPYAALRDLAKKYGITNYSRHPKFVLISLIREKEKQNEEKRLIETVSRGGSVHAEETPAGTRISCSS